MATRQRRTPARKRRPAVAGLSGRSTSDDTHVAGTTQDDPDQANTPDEREQIVLEESAAEPDDAQQVSGEDEGPSKPQRRWRFPRRMTVVKQLITVTVLCSALAIGFGAAAQGLRSDAAAQNKALVDTESTRAVSEQVTNAIRTAFSYHHGDPEATQQHAQESLVGAAVQQYNKLFEQVKKVARQQLLTFTTTVRAIGVTHLDGDRARLLVFVDQQGVRADKSQRRSGSAQLEIAAKRFGQHWKINEITVL